MGLWKRGHWTWLDVVVNGHRYREPLGTTDWREARRLERERVEQLQRRDPSHPARASRMRPSTSTRRSTRTPRNGAPRCHRAWSPTGPRTRAARACFGTPPLRQHHTGEHRGVSERADRCGTRAEDGQRRALGPAPGPKRAQLWYRFEEDYARSGTRSRRSARRSRMKNSSACSPPRGRSPAGSSRTSPRRSRSTAACARARSKGCSGSTSTGPTRGSQIRRSKTPAGWRDPELQRRLPRRHCGSSTRAPSSRLREARPLRVPVARPRQEDRSDASR